MSSESKKDIHLDFAFWMPKFLADAGPPLSFLLYIKGIFILIVANKLG